MKAVLIASFFLLSLMVVKAQPPAGSANPGNTYGEKITADGAISVKDLNAKLKKSTTYTGKITGKVLSACPKKGCWMNIEMPDKTEMMVKFKDYGFFVPTDIVGKTVVLDGEAMEKTVSVEELKHYAKDAKKSQADIDAITKPEKQIRFMANGVLVQK